MLLKKAVSKDFTPAQIAAIMCREGLQKSPLEKVHAHAMTKCKYEEVDISQDDVTYLHHVSAALDELFTD